MSRKTMKVIASKTMAKEIAKNIDGAAYCVDDIQYMEVPYAWYEMNVRSDTFEYENDWILDKGKFRVICVHYQPEEYAYPKFLTTNDLLRICKKCDGSYKGFFEEVNNEIRI